MADSIKKLQFYYDIFELRIKRKTERIGASSFKTRQQMADAGITALPQP